MTVEEAFELYAVAHRVADPDKVAPDLEFVAEPEEYDCDWRIVELPIDITGCDLSLSPTPGNDIEYEENRFRVIREWMAEKGIDAAMALSPPIVRFNDGPEIELMDGRHRLALLHEAGRRNVRFLVGAEPGWVPHPIPSPHR